VLIEAARSVGMPAHVAVTTHNVAEWCRAVCFAGYQPRYEASPIVAAPYFWLGAEAERV
jgi:hypothetical protein